MKPRHRTKLVREGDYVAEVEVELIETEEGWSPYLSVEDVYKLDDVRDALRRGVLHAASRLARVFKLTPVTMTPKPGNEPVQSGPR
jgi:hypothetical protein